MKERYRVKLRSALAVAGLSATVLATVAVPAGADHNATHRPIYKGTVAGPGLADMYPVDVAATDTHYYVVDPGRYRVAVVNRATGQVDFEKGGHYGRMDGQFGAHRAIAIDSAGNVYVADTANNRVQKFDADMNFIKKWGTKGTGPGQFNLPYGIATGMGKGPGGVSQEVLYVTEGGNRVQKFDLDGNFISQFGTGGVLVQPRQVHVHPVTKNVYVVSGTQKNVVVFNQNGNELFRFGSPGKLDGQFMEDPRGLSITDDGTVFVSDDGNKRVQAFDSNGTFLFKFGLKDTPGALTDPRGLDVTSDGKVIVSDEWDYSLKEYSATDGTFIRELFGAFPPAGGFNSPRGLAVDATGRLYGTDWWNQRIQRFDADGSNPIAWGFRGHPRNPGSINFAWDTAIQPSTGRVFVANRESHEIEIFDANGNFVNRFGTRGTAHGQFLFPQGVAFDHHGMLLVADSGNHRIERYWIDSLGTGNYVESYGTHGGPASAPGNLNIPTGIDVADDGTVWIADTRNNRIQKRTTSGAWTAYKALPDGSNFGAPWGVSVAPDGTIWVADSGKDRIVKMSSTGTVHFIARGGQMGAGAFDAPFDIEFGPSGEIYVSDTWNNRIVELGY